MNKAKSWRERARDAVATITIHSPNRMNARGRVEILRWLHAQAHWVKKYWRDLGPRFTARYYYRRSKKSVKEETMPPAITRRDKAAKRRVEKTLSVCSSEFERAFLRWAIEEGPDFFSDETVEAVIRPLLEAEGLLLQEPYNPSKHGEGVDAAPGDPIWTWTGKAYARAGKVEKS